MQPTYAELSDALLSANRDREQLVDKINAQARTIAALKSDLNDVAPEDCEIDFDEGSVRVPQSVQLSAIMQLINQNYTEYDGILEREYLAWAKRENAANREPCV
jgi:hypothetical protein